MTTSTNLMRQRRFLPLFLTQLLNALNDNLYKNAMVLFIVYQVYLLLLDDRIFIMQESSIRLKQLSAKC